MAALRWFLFSLLTFGGGAVAAFAMHPPQLGIPEASAADLRQRLARIEQLASEGRCTGMNSQLSAAQSTIDRLPSNTAVTVEQQLQDALAKVRDEARSTCIRVAGAKQDLEAQAQATTPAPTPDPTPEPTTEPTPTPDAGSSTDGGGPDPGTGEGATPAPGPGNGNGNGNGNPGGGGALPQGDAGAAVQQGLDRARERYRKARDEIERGLDELLQQGAGQ